MYRKPWTGPTIVTTPGESAAYLRITPTVSTSRPTPVRYAMNRNRARDPFIDLLSVSRAQRREVAVVLRHRVVDLVRVGGLAPLGRRAPGGGRRGGRLVGDGLFRHGNGSSSGPGFPGVLF